MVPPSFMNNTLQHEVLKITDLVPDSFFQRNNHLWSIGIDQTFGTVPPEHRLASCISWYVFPTVQDPICFI